MKMLTVLLVVVCLQAAATGYSQEKINLSLKNASVRDVLTSIQKQTDYRFIILNLGEKPSPSGEDFSKFVRCKSTGKVAILFMT